MGVSDRSLFLETIKTEPLTINQIMERFDVSRNTANKWAKHEAVAVVIGSYPKTYTRSNSLGTEMPAPKPVPKTGDDTLVISLTKPSQDRVRELWQQVMDDSVPHMDFIHQVRVAESRSDLKKIRNNLYTSILVLEYYEELMEQDGVE